MANSSPTYWSVDGVSLQTFAQNISTWGGAKQAPPEMRGEDIEIPYIVGSQFVEKIPTSRLLPLEMWIIGADSNGRVPTSKTMQRTFQDNFVALRKLLWRPDEQFELTKRWYDSGGTLRTATALAQFESGFEPEMTGNARAGFLVELRLSDPFFYGSEVTHVLDSGNNSVNILGDYKTTDMTIAFSGARSNPRLRNVAKGLSVQVTRDLTSGQTVTLDTKKWTAKLGSSTNVIREVEFSGGKQWFTLHTGSQTLALSGTGAGTATLKYKPRYL